MPPTPSMLSRREVVLCVGPGGVGKTSCAAALALSAAARGRKVVVVTIDPSRRLAQALGVADADGMHVGALTTVPRVDTHGRLDALILETRRVFDDIVRQCSPSAKDAEAMLNNPIYRATVEHLGGSLEYAAMAEVQMLHARGDHDLVVLDTPPIANAIDFFEAPGRVREVASNPAARILAGTGRIGMKILGLGGGAVMKVLQSIGGGPFIADLGIFLRDFGEVLREFQRRAGDVEELLGSPSTGVVLVTSPSEFSVREACDFLQGIAARGLRVDAVALNQVDPVLPDPPDDEVLFAALRAQLGDRAETELPRISAVYRDAKIRGDQGRRAHAELRRRFPTIPIHEFLRREPPPIDLAALTAMGEDLLTLADTAGR